MSPWWLNPLAPGEEGGKEEEPVGADFEVTKPPPDAGRGDAKAAGKGRGSRRASDAGGEGNGSSDRRSQRGSGRKRSGEAEQAKARSGGDDGSRKQRDEGRPSAEERDGRRSSGRGQGEGGAGDGRRTASSGGKRKDQDSAGDGGKRKDGGRSKAGAGRGEQREAAARRDEADEAFAAPEHEEGLFASERTQSVNDERTIALFCDLENIALGVRDSAEVKKFDINLVLARLLEKGKIIVKKAYCDWERYSDFKRAFHEAGIEMIDIPQKYYSGKNSADIKMVVDAIDVAYAKEHVDTFAILSGDSDFTPLVSKLKENNKNVIGVGVKGSSSKLLIGNCDEFIFYEDIWRSRQQAPQLGDLPKKTAEVFALMTDAIQALIRENKDVLWGSMVKQTMMRKQPSFNEGYYGYGSFSELLEDAEAKKVIRLKKDQRSGSYIVTGFSRNRPA